MPNANVNKVIYDGRTIIDISDSELLPERIIAPYVGYAPSGARIVGTASGEDIIIRSGWRVDGETLVIDDGGTAPIDLQSKSKSYTPSETTQSETVTADSGYDGLSSVAVSVGAIPSSYVGTGVTRRTSSDLTASGATVNVPSGYYSSSASKSVPSGTEGTPTATKGTVSNHSVTVTPSVTNSAGYISGGTRTGSGVSVSASELVSGTLPVTESGTYDVTNYENVNVNVSGGKAFQWVNEGARVAATSYTATDVSLTVEKSGTYTISWSGFRNNSSGTYGSQLYVNGYARGSAFTTFSDSYWQAPKLTGQSLNAGDVLVVRARSRSTTNYYMCVANLIIEEE